MGRRSRANFMAIALEHNCSCNKAGCKGGRLGFRVAPFAIGACISRCFCHLVSIKAFNHFCVETSAFYSINLEVLVGNYIIPFDIIVKLLYYQNGGRLTKNRVMSINHCTLPFNTRNGGMCNTTARFVGQFMQLLYHFILGTKWRQCRPKTTFCQALRVFCPIKLEHFNSGSVFYPIKVKVFAKNYIIPFYSIRKLYTFKMAAD